MVIEIESIMSVTCWNYLEKTPTVFEVNARQSEGAKDEDKLRNSKKKTKQHNMCWTSLFTMCKQAQIT
jgi:hypothetical protein